MKIPQTHFCHFIQASFQFAGTHQLHLPSQGERQAATESPHLLVLRRVDVVRHRRHVGQLLLVELETFHGTIRGLWGDENHPTIRPLGMSTVTLW